jgi:transmembrane sensor
METDKYSNYYTTEDFILDKDFTLWVLHPDKEVDQFWNSFMLEHPEKENQIRDAALIIRALQPLEDKVPQQSLDDILQITKRAGTGIRLKRYSMLKYAAGMALLITVGGLIWLSVLTKNKYNIETAGEQVIKGKIIFANGSTQEFDTEQTTIKQTSSG